MSPVPDKRLYFLPAADRPRTIVLFRAAARLWRMAVWDARAGTLRPGQWLRRDLRIDGCRVAPDGQHLIAPIYHPRDGLYTVLTRPPYFTALGLFHNGLSSFGGGGFVTRRRYFIHGADRERDYIGRTKGLWQVPPPPVDPYGLRYPTPGAPVRATPDLRAEGTRLIHVARDGDHCIAEFGEMRFASVTAPYEWRAQPRIERSRS